MNDKKTPCFFQATEEEPIKARVTTISASDLSRNIVLGYDTGTWVTRQCTDLANQLTISDMHTSLWQDYCGRSRMRVTVEAEIAESVATFDTLNLLQDLHMFEEMTRTHTPQGFHLRLTGVQEELHEACYKRIIEQVNKGKNNE